MENENEPFLRSAASEMKPLTTNWSRIHLCEPKFVNNNLSFWKIDGDLMFKVDVQDGHSVNHQDQFVQCQTARYFRR